MTTFGSVDVAMSLQIAVNCKLNYGVIDAQANIPDDWRSSSPTMDRRRIFLLSMHQPSEFKFPKENSVGKQK